MHTLPGLHRWRVSQRSNGDCTRPDRSYSMRSHRAHPAPSRALARGGARAFRHRPAGRNDPRSVARRPLPRLRHRTGHGVLRHLKRPAAPKCASRTPCSAAPSPPAAAFAGAPATRKSPCLTSGPTFVTLRPWKRTLSASDSGPTPRRAKSDFLSLEDSHVSTSPHWRRVLASLIAAHCT